MTGSSPTDPALPISGRLAVDALHQGIDAADSGEPVGTCPYGPHDEVAQQFATQWWIKGWRRRNAALDDTADG